MYNLFKKIVPISSINSYDAVKLIEISEREYNSQIIETAEKLAETKGEKPFLLISGPSGSGKTVTSYRIKETLEKNGHSVMVLSMDNYFLPLDNPKNQVDANGKIDLESPARLDIELLNEQTDKIFRCEEVQIPIFDFANQKRRKGTSYKRGKNDIVIMEGIHALNPKVTGSMACKSKNLYVSVRTRIKKSDGKLLHPSKIRLMRRLVRDNLFRGREFSQTFEFFANVERGEKLYIMPFKHHADYEIDTFMPFEPCVYKNFLSGKLKNFNKKSEFFNDAAYLTEYFSELNDIDISHVPINSLVREFTGGNHLMES